MNDSPSSPPYDGTWQPLRGVRVIEAASFVAVPLAGMTLAQLGADVIRVDPPGGGSDINRWPLAQNGRSLFWANLNKGKRSVAIDYRTPEGRELLMNLATAPGEGGGVFLDNMVGRRRIRYEELTARRPDVIHVHVQGRSNGGPAVDYTVNAEVGVPQMTGPADTDVPSNHVVPIWDMLTGMSSAMLISSALHQRSATGRGTSLDLALADIALAGVASMGWLAEADAAGRPRPRHGNHVFGSFGVDFETSDGQRVMIVALTQGQWDALRDVTETGAVFAALEEVLDADLSLESDRYRLRETIASVLRPWFLARDFETVRDLLDEARVLWSPYRDMAEVAKVARADDGQFVADVDQPGIGAALATGSPWRSNDTRSQALPAPSLAGNTDQVLTDQLGLTTSDLDDLRQAGVIG